jgi:hypothetical protein
VGGAEEPRACRRSRHGGDSLRNGGLALSDISIPLPAFLKLAKAILQGIIVAPVLSACSLSILPRPEDAQYQHVACRRVPACVAGDAVSNSMLLNYEFAPSVGLARMAARVTSQFQNRALDVSKPSPRPRPCTRLRKPGANAVEVTSCPT